MTTEVVAVTVPALMEKVVEFEPCGIVTVDDTLATDVLELEREITAPPAPAGPESVTVPMLD
jgi:hypothetical protein